MSVAKPAQKAPLITLSKHSERLKLPIIRSVESTNISNESIMAGDPTGKTTPLTPTAKSIKGTNDLTGESVLLTTPRKR